VPARFRELNCNALVRARTVRRRTSRERGNIMLRKLTASAVALIGLVGPAFAVDGKDLPGNACSPKYHSTEYRRSGSAVWNESGASSVWYCPLPKDSSNDFTGDVTVVDLSSGYDVRCTMHSRSRTGELLGTSSRVSLAGVQTTPQTLPRFSKLNGVTHSHAHFECTLPPSSAIVSYEMDED
jgi:hypothetical protein